MRLSKQHGGSRGNDGAKRYFCLCVEGREIRAELCAERKDPMKSKESAMQERKGRRMRRGGVGTRREEDFSSTVTVEGTWSLVRRRHVQKLNEFLLDEVGSKAYPSREKLRTGQRGLRKEGKMLRNNFGEGKSRHPEEYFRISRQHYYYRHS